MIVYHIICNWLSFAGRKKISAVNITILDVTAPELFFSEISLGEIHEE